jgi:hypothetical protein
MERIEHIDSKECKGQKTITIHLKGGNEPRLMLSPQVRLKKFSSHLMSFVFFTHNVCVFFFLDIIKPKKRNLLSVYQSACVSLLFVLIRMNVINSIVLILFGRILYNKKNTHLPIG